MNDDGLSYDDEVELAGMPPKLKKAKITIAGTFEQHLSDEDYTRLTQLGESLDFECVANVRMVGKATHKDGTIPVVRLTITDTTLI